MQQPALAPAQQRKAKPVPAPQPAAPGRLQTQIEHHQVGVQRNILTGALEPVIKSFHIGHGQQIARRRMAEKQAHHAVVYGDLPPPAPSRQQHRRGARKAAKIRPVEAQRRELRDRKAASR